MNNIDHQQNMSALYCFPEKNTSCTKEVRKGPAYIIMYIFLSSISMCTVFLNLLVIISISHFKQLHTPTNLIILSLAVADLLVGLIVMPVTILQMMDSCWYLGELACCFFLVTDSILMSASLCSLVLIAVDQYLAVCYPLLYPVRVTICNTSLVILLCWSFVVFYIISCSYFNDHFLPTQVSSRCYGECVMTVKYSWVITDIVISLLAPCCVILILYSVIFNVARRQSKAVRATKKGSSNKQGAKVSGSSETKAAKKLSTIIFIYLACWIPYYLGSLTVTVTLSVVLMLFQWLVLFSSSVNPLIYAIFYPWFRKSIRYIVTCRIYLPSSSKMYLFPKHF
ncbi:trace amine-associated receptor 13c-like [Hoplias malabaricus]|uniref:trace amine-associated receptor 13c-like n=1 Tax=Hoplias malabaricus TaxID=27720 RepID=UPI003461B901